MTPVRRCAWCGQEKPVDDFRPDVWNRSGRDGVCIACREAGLAAKNADEERLAKFSPGAVKSMCKSKRRYNTNAEATAAAAGKALRRAGLLRPYPCPICQGWHLTHHPRREFGAERRAQ